MSATKNLVGQTFGRLTVIERVPNPPGRNSRWSCLCDCGQEVAVSSNHLRSGHTASCGCLQRERSTQANKKHGMSRTPLYLVWDAMKKRCSDKNNKRWNDYGGRGITVCPEWMNSFETFRDWALANGYREGLTIDRKNNDGDYTPQNCRWVTHKKQANNRRARETSTFLRGENHHQSKLTDRQVKTIRKLRSEGLLLREIAGRFGVHKDTIAAVLNGRTWRHVK